MKLKKHGNLFSMQLQYFAEDDGASDGAEPISFASQSELDSFIDERLNAEKTTWKSEAQKAIDDAKTEGQKMAQMTAEQQAKYEEEQRSTELAKRESEITRRELRAHSLELLAEKSLPKELIDIVVLTDADACSKSIDAVEKSFSSAVQKAVDERLATSAGSLPGVSGSSNGKTEAGSIGRRLAEQGLQAKQQKSVYFKN